MTMWFSVKVGLPGGDLGLWSSCGGLEVQFATESLNVGGRYDRATVLPTTVSYPNITLERAMNTVDSRKVQDWLRHVTRTWTNAAEGGAPLEKSRSGGGRFHPGTTVKIELYHRLGETPVSSWQLHDVVPVSWSAPPLSTTGGTVALEKLVLAHGGFLDTDQSGSSSVAGLGQLVLTGPDTGKITFQYNPDTVTVHRMASVSTGNRQDRDEYDLQITNAGRWELSYKKLVVEGEQAVRTATDLLRTWSAPDPANPTAPKELRVLLGDGRNTLLSRRVVLWDVTIDYTRFTPNGTPCRATVALSFMGVSQHDDAAPWRSATPTRSEPFRVTSGGFV
jgi:phage tail-like protein